MKFKKLSISLGTLSTIAFPLVSVIACSPEDDKDKHHHEHEEGEHGHDIKQADVDKLDKEIEISGVTSSSTDAQIKSKIKAVLESKMKSMDEGEPKEALEHLLEHHWSDAVLDKDKKTLTIEADGTTYEVTYSVK